MIVLPLEHSAINASLFPSERADLQRPRGELRRGAATMGIALGGVRGWDAAFGEEGGSIGISGSALPTASGNRMILGEVDLSL